MTTTLSTAQQDELIERIACVATRTKIAPFVQFLLEANRAISPITGNMLIAASPIFSPLVPLNLQHLGILIQEDSLVQRLQERIAAIASDSNE